MWVTGGEKQNKPWAGSSHTRGVEFSSSLALPHASHIKQTYRKETRSPSAILSRAVNKSSSVIIHIKTFLASHGITGLLQKPQRKARIRSWSSALIVGVRKDCLVCHHRLKMFKYQHLIQTHLISDQHESLFLRTMWQNTVFFQSSSSHLENTVVVFKDWGNVTIHHKNIYHK